MDDRQKRIQAVQSRTDSKLEYARIQLDEMVAHGITKGGPFIRSHEEAFLFHLIGVRDAFLQELNEYYGCELLLRKVTADRLRKATKAKSGTCSELDQLDAVDWLPTAEELRNHGTHRHHISRNFKVLVGSAGKGAKKVHLYHPVTEEEITEDEESLFKGWLSKMDALIKRLRESALKANP